MKHYKPPKTRIKVKIVTKKNGTIYNEYTPQVKNNKWFLYWIFFILITPFVAFLSIFCPPLVEVFWYILKDKCSFYNQISPEKNIFECFIFQQDKTIENAKTSIEKYLLQHYENWQKSNIINQNKTANIKIEYINHP